MKREAGFTLIEIIAVLIIGGIMMTVAGMAIVTGMKGYLFARDNASITQKAQLAMTRMNRELTELTNITNIDQSMPNAIPNVTYERFDGNNPIIQTIYLYLDPNDDTNKTIRIASESDDPSDGEGDILVNRVSDLSLTYNPNEAGISTWAVGIDIRSLYAVKIKLELERYEDDRVVEFSTTVNPRNNKNSGGDP